MVATTQLDEELIAPVNDLGGTLVDDIDLAFAVDSQWGNGFNAGVILTNNSGEEVTEWEITFTTTYAITKVWQAELLSSSFDNGVYTYIVGNAPSWNDTITVGGTVTFGYTGSGSPSAPTSYDVFSNVPPGAPVGSSDTATDGDITITATIIDDYGTGFETDITFTNDGSETFKNWQLTITTANEITRLWNAEIISSSLDGGQYTYIVGNAPTWNQDIESGESASFGFNSKGDDPGFPSEYDVIEALPPAPSTGTIDSLDSGNIAVNLMIGSIWDTGFNTQVFLTNTDLNSNPFEDWQLTITTGYAITDIWNAEIVSESNSSGVYTYTISTSHDWNSTINPGKTVSFGYAASGTPTLPDDYEVSGAAPIDPLVGQISTTTDGDYTLDYTITNAWGSAYQSEITLTNGGSEQLRYWQLSFTTTTQLTNTWGIEIISETLENGVYTYVLGNPPVYNSIVEAGQSITFGYTASGSTEVPTQLDVGIDQVAVEGGADDLQIGDVYTTTDGVMGISVHIEDVWNNGYQTKIVLANNDSSPEADSFRLWELNFTLNSKINRIWNAEIILETFENGVYYYVIGNPPAFSENIKPGETVDFGFSTFGQTAPSDFLLTSNFEYVPPAPVIGSLDDDVDPNVTFELTVVKQWDGGHSVDVVMDNPVFTPGVPPLKDWEVTLTMRSQITNIWNASILSEFVNDGIFTYVIGNSPSWNDSVGFEDPATFGYTADGDTVGILSYNIGSALETNSGVGFGALTSPFGETEYGDVLNLSMLFYYAQRSGELPDDNPISWRGDSALTDGADVGLDLTGGWYDAGDHVKFHFAAAYTTTMLAWGAIEFKDGYVEAGADDELLDHLRWETDYLLRTVVYDANGEVDWIAGQVGAGQIDHKFWVTPEEMTMERPTYVIDRQNPGSDLAGEMAASFAAASIVFRQAGDSEYADLLLQNAIAVYDFAETYLGIYTDTITDAAYFKLSRGYEDELAWGATWLFLATSELDYLEKAESLHEYPGSDFSWDDKAAGVTELLYQVTGKQRYQDALDNYFDQWMNVLPKTPGTADNAGLSWITDWGTNAAASRAAFLASVHAQTLNDLGIRSEYGADLMEFASDQIDYMLGNNPSNQSYVDGYGVNNPVYVHHRSASGTDTVTDLTPNEHELLGALVGGPGLDGSFNDERENYYQTEPTIVYNAGFSGALAGLLEYSANNNNFV